MARPHIEPYVELDFPYKKFDISGFSGSHYKVMSLDTDSGACTLKVKFDGGYKRKPGLSYSDVEFIVLTGRMKIGDEVCTQGHYMFVPAGVALGAISVPQGCEILLMYNDSEPSWAESDRNHPLALTAAYMSLNTYTGAPWGSGSIVTPSVASGCLIKPLHYDPLTEAISFLYCMTPQFAQDNISYHDCAEESYHIWGDSWMMQFGVLQSNRRLCGKTFHEQLVFGREREVVAPVLVAVFPDVRHLKPFRQIEIDLNGGHLPVPA